MLNWISSFHFLHFVTQDISTRTETEDKYNQITALIDDLQTTLLLAVFIKDNGDSVPSRIVFALVISFGRKAVEPDAFLWPMFILFILSSSSFPMVLDLTRGNLDLIDNRCKPSLLELIWIGNCRKNICSHRIRCDGLGEGWDTDASEQIWGIIEATVTLSGSPDILTKMQQWRHTNFRQSRQV